MRLTCPNCGAQYEVPDEVIPQEGRDVQCSNCGDTWFQTHANDPMPADPPPPVDAPTAIEAGPDDDPDDYDDDLDYDDDEDPADSFDPPPEPAPRKFDDSVTDLLREEAERESELRAAPAGGGLESQPELGLEASDGDAARRAREARERMSRMRGEDPASATNNPTAAESRRGLLPDIEDINSTLKSGDPQLSHTAISTSVSEDHPARRKSGFSRGFAISMLIVVILVLIYANAPKIASAVPQIDPVLNSYVTAVDQARLWLDGLISKLTPK